MKSSRALYSAKHFDRRCTSTSLFSVHKSVHQNSFSSLSKQTKDTIKGFSEFQNGGWKSSDEHFHFNQKVHQASTTTALIAGAVVSLAVLPIYYFWGGSKPSEGENEEKMIVTPEIEELLNEFQRCRKNEDYRGALRALDDLIALRPNSIFLHTQKANFHAAMNETDHALETYDDIIKIYPKNADLYLQKAYILIRNDMLEEAKEVYDKILEIHPKNALAYFNLGIYHVKKQEYQEASNAFAKSTKYDPNDVDSYYNLAIALFRLEKLGDAIKAMDNVIKRNPNHELAYHNRGLFYMKHNQNYKKALDSFDQVIRINPNNVNAYTMRSYCLSYLGKNDEAMACINHAISLNPKDSLALMTKAHLYEQVSDLENAMKAYEAVLRVDSMNKRAREEIVRIEEELYKQQQEENQK